MSSLILAVLLAATEKAPPLEAPPAEPSAEAGTTATAPSTFTNTTHDGAHGIRLGLKLGPVFPTSSLGATVGIGLDAEYRPDVLGRLLGVGLELGYAAPNDSGTLQDPSVGSYDYELKTRILSVALEVVARRSFGRLEPYAALGWALVALRAKTEAFAIETTETQLRSGLQLRGGLGYQVGPGDVFGELRYQYASYAFESTGDASAGTLAIALGYRFAF
ncbi:MAG: outer membrane beta-barrel protein [Myxococcota bacterium]